MSVLQPPLQNEEKLPLTLDKVQEGDAAFSILMPSAQKITKTLAGIALLLIFFSVLGHALQFRYGTDRFQEFVRLFNLSGERNVPTWFSSSLALCCAMLLAAIGAKCRQRRAPYHRHWLILSFCFLFISLSGTATIHDWTLERPLVQALELPGAFSFPWVIVGWTVVLGMSLGYWQFVSGLPAQTRSNFILAAVLYVTGALLLEMVSAYLMDYHLNLTLWRGIVATLQESLEIAGIILFMHGLISYLDSLNIKFI